MTEYEKMRKLTANKDLKAVLEEFKQKCIQCGQGEKFDNFMVFANEEYKKAETKLLSILTYGVQRLPNETPQDMERLKAVYKASITNRLQQEKLDWNSIDTSDITKKYNELLEKLERLEEKLNKATDPKEVDELQEELDRIKYDILPSSSALYLFNSALTHHNKRKKIETTKNGTKQSDRHKEISYTAASGKGYTITQRDKRTGDQIELTLTNADKLKGKCVKKCFAFLLTMSNKQKFSPVISFSLQELVDRGMYSSLDNARRGLKSALDTLQNIKFRGTIKKGKKNEISQAEAGVLFYHYKIKNNFVEVSVNENFNIEFIASYYALFPQYAYSLTNSNAFDLCEYIFMRARQNTAAIKRDNKFNISFKRIRELLALPTQEEIEAKGSKWKPKQYVIDPILTAIKDIQEAAKASNNTEVSFVTRKMCENKHLCDFLEGYLEVSFEGEMHEKLSKIATLQEKRISEMARRNGKFLEQKE